MTTRHAGANRSDLPSQEEDGPTLPAHAAAATLPATQPPDSGSPTPTLPSQDRQNPHNVQIQSGTEEAAAAAAAAAAAGEGINSDSFHRRIHEDYRYHHQHQPHKEGNLSPAIFVPGAESSIGEEWIPASAQHAQQHSRGGWSYSEGDEINLPETSLLGDAQFSRIDGERGAAVATEDGGDAAAAQQRLQTLLRQQYGPGYTLIVQKGPQRKPVHDRYPAYRQNQQEFSMMASVCQPTPAAGDGDGDELIPFSPSASAGAGGAKLTKVATRVSIDDGLEGAKMAMPTPQQHFRGNSAAHQNLTPEQKEAIEGRKKAALARRAELERERGNKVARNLHFDSGCVVGVPHHRQQQEQQQQLAAPPPPAVIQAYPSPCSALSPSQAQRVEENRQRALSIRQNKLMGEAVALAHAVLSSNLSSCSGGGSTNLSGWKARIEQDIRKVIAAQRHGAHVTSSSASSSLLSTPTPPCPAAAAAPTPPCPAAGGGGSRQLTPEQRHRIEMNRQKALQRQKGKIEEGVAAFLSAAMQRAQKEKAAAVTGEARAPQQNTDDQTFRRFL